MAEVRVLPSGPRALLLEIDEPHVTAVAAAVAIVRGVTEVVPGACTVLVEHDGSATAPADIVAAARTAPLSPATAAGVRVVTFEVRYDGPDLGDVAGLCGLSPQHVASLHAGAEYVVAFCGFAPGFAYLTGLPAPLHLPRRATPRTRVPAGSVAIAGPYSAVYPSASPGGWHLLGRTTAALWDPTADPPALLTPGTRVRFRAVGP